MFNKVLVIPSMRPHSSHGQASLVLNRQACRLAHVNVKCPERRSIENNTTGKLNTHYNCNSFHWDSCGILLSTKSYNKIELWFPNGDAFGPFSGKIMLTPNVSFKHFAPGRIF